jgi:integrase
VTAIADYLTLKDGSHAYKSASVRLRHCLNFIVETNPAMRCANVNERTIEQFRTYMSKKTYRTPAGRVKPLSLSTTEGCVLALAAAINATGEKAQFKAMNLRSVSNTPQYRSSIKEIAAMFAYAMERKDRENLLRYLRASVATMARPDAVMDIGNHRRQWVSAARVLNLNPEGRRQTKKHRPTIPIARQFAPHLDALDGFYIPIDSIRKSWSRMAVKLGLPTEGEAGWKLIRRSMATLLRNRLGEAYMPQIERMLGHRQESMSDIYALASPSQLGAALAEIEAIIEEVQELTPNAY